jgi:membrane fusion protein, multidrug efflux system
MKRRWIGSTLLLLSIVGVGAGLAAWKHSSLKQADAASANQPEAAELVTVSVAKKVEHRQTTTSIGTVVALRSITLRNEVAGTVREALLMPGQIVEAGTVLVGLDVSVEQAELRALQAQARLAQTSLERTQRLSQNRFVSDTAVDRARAERDIALAQSARTKAIIARKTIRAPFRARVGMANVHPGQYLGEGTQLTTLQGIDAAAYVDFAVAQQVAASLHEGSSVEVFVGSDMRSTEAKIVAVDARVEPTTRNALVRARIDRDAPAPGASVRVRVPVGVSHSAVAVSASALRKGPGGDHVFVLKPDKDGKTRAHLQLVQVGAMLGDEVMILDGLSGGEQLAASGSFKLREAMLVTIAGDSSANAGETK